LRSTDGSFDRFVDRFDDRLEALLARRVVVTVMFAPSR